MIIRGGENIYPAEIEQFLHTHPKVQEAQVGMLTRHIILLHRYFLRMSKVAMPLGLSTQVIGVKDERMGEEVCACIKLKADQECTAEEIREYCKGKVRTICVRSVLSVSRHRYTTGSHVPLNYYCFFSSSDCSL